MSQNLREEFDTLKSGLNDQLWSIAGKLPDGLEDVLTTIERLIENMDKRLP